jgi:hypothetical protein
MTQPPEGPNAQPFPRSPSHRVEGSIETQVRDSYPFLECSTGCSLESCIEEKGQQRVVYQFL